MARKPAKIKGVYERNGRWYARYRQAGVDVRKSFGRDRGAAEDYLKKAHTLQRTGEGVVPTTAKRPVLTAAEMTLTQSSVLLGDLCDELKQKIASDPEHYRDQYNPPRRLDRIKQNFGNRSASSIRPYEISDWLSSLKGPNGKRLSPGSWNRYRTVFSSIYTYGIEREKLTDNPVRKFSRKKEPDGLIRFLDDAEELRLRKVLDDAVAATPGTHPVLREQRLHRIFEIDLALGLGARKSEQYRISEDDVNFDRNEIVIGRTKYGPPRTIEMNRDVQRAVRGLMNLSLLTPREWKKGRPSRVPANCIFSITENRTWFKDALNKAGIKKFHWHCLRHTFISRLVQKGVNLKIVQSWRATVRSQ